MGRPTGLLEAIKMYLSKLQFNDLSTSIKPSLVTDEATGVISLMVTDIDSLYDILLPFFNSLNFESRKYIDYKLWSVTPNRCLNEINFIYLKEELRS